MFTWPMIFFLYFLQKKVHLSNHATPRTAWNWFICFLLSNILRVCSLHNVIPLASKFPFSIFTAGRENTIRLETKNFPGIFSQQKRPSFYGCDLKFQMRVNKKTPNPVKAYESALQRRGLPQVSAHWRGFPGRCHLMQRLMDQLLLYLIVQNALGRFRLWFSAL